MKGDRTQDREALVNRYGLSARLAARVAALLTRKMDVTETLLEMAPSSPGLRQLLLDRDLLKEPEAVDEDALRSKARQSGFEEHDLIRLVEGEEGWRTIALEDDVLAAQAGSPEGTSELVSTEIITRPEEGITRSETEELFSAEEVARLKLDALTSQEAEKRTEALRKLVYAPMPGAQKAGVFVQVLVDSGAGPAIRREAVRSLQQIGFRQDIADAVRHLFEAEEDEVLYAIQRLEALLKEADEGDRGVAVAVVLEVFDETDRPAVIRQLLSLTAGSAEVLVGSREKTEHFVQTALRHLTRDFEGLRPEVEQALEACHRRAAEMMEELLWKELQRTGEASVRGFLVHLLASLTESSERRDELAAAAVEQIIEPRLRESQRSHLRYGLVGMGEPAVRAARERLPSAEGRQRAELVRLLDVVCTEGDVSDEELNDVVRTLLDLLRVGERGIRRRILEASVLAAEGVDEGLQEELSRELLSHMTEFQMESTHEMIGRSLEKIGLPALPPLLDYIRRRFPEEEAHLCLETLGRIARDKGADMPPELTREALDFCQGIFEDGGQTRGEFTLALAYLCGYTEPGAERFQEVLNALQERVWQVRYTFDIFEALGIMAGSANVRGEQQSRLFDLFDSVVSMKAPDVLGSRKETEEGTVYEFGAEVMFDTRVLPSVVRGLERIAVGEKTPGELRREVVKRLLILWEGVSKVRVVWGPAAMEALIRAICNTACSEYTEAGVQARFARSLLRFLNKVSVVRSLGEICADTPESEQMQELCVETVDEMLSEWEESEEQDEERRIALLESLGRIAANPALDAEDEEVRRLRANVLEALFQGLREGIDEVRFPLQELRDCPDITEEQRTEIEERLNRAFGLVRVGR